MLSSGSIRIHFCLGGPRREFSFNSKGDNSSLFCLLYFTLKQIRPHIDTPKGYLQFAFFCTASNTAHVNTSKKTTFQQSLDNIAQFGISFTEEEQSFLKDCDFYNRHMDLSANFAGKSFFSNKEMHCLFLIILFRSSRKTGTKFLQKGCGGLYHLLAWRLPARWCDMLIFLVLLLKLLFHRT